MPNEPVTVHLLVALLAVLVVAAMAAGVWKRSARDGIARECAALVLARVRMWWAMSAVLLVATLAGRMGSVLVFGLTSFLLLREFVTITPTRRGDHHVLFWVFFAILPLQYYFLAIGWYGMFIIAIPVYAFLFVPIRAAIAGDAERFLERTAKIQWGLMVCVYSIAHAPALLRLEIPGAPGAGLRLLVFLTGVVQVADLTNRLADAVMRRPGLAGEEGAPSRRLPGFVLGLGLAALTGLGLAWAVPFDGAQAVGMALAAALAAAGGSLCLDAIQRDRGRKGVVVVQTRSSMIERVIPLCFAAPLFFHLTRYFFVAGARAGF
jgi:phosphatidate cytidylyltransferase